MTTDEFSSTRLPEDRGSGPQVWTHFQIVTNWRPEEYWLCDQCTVADYTYRFDLMGDHYTAEEVETPEGVIAVADRVNVELGIVDDPTKDPLRPVREEAPAGTRCFDCDAEVTVAA